MSEHLCLNIIRSVFWNIPGIMLVNILASVVGLTVYAYYAVIGCDPLEQKYIANANQVKSLLVNIVVKTAKIMSPILLFI